MSNNTVAQVAQATVDYPVNLTNVGGATGAVIAASLMFAYIWSKFRKDNAENGAGNTLYTNIADQLEKLTKRLDVVEEERDQWQQKAISLEARLKAVEGIEESHKRLLERLDLKDTLILEKEQQVASLLQEASIKSAQIQNLIEKVHALEMQVAKLSSPQCTSCHHVGRF